MNKYRILFSLFVCVLLVTTAYCQEKPDIQLIKNITGTVISTDSVGNTISIRTEDQKIMAFFVPDKAHMTQETHNIGLMDIVKSDSVTIQYYVLPSSKDTVISIVDNESTVNE